MRANKFDREKALEEFADAEAAYAEQKVWRAEAAGLVPDLEAYLDGIRATLGIRSQPRLNREQALYMASCNAKHQDISLNF